MQRRERAAAEAQAAFDAAGRAEAEAGVGGVPCLALVPPRGAPAPASNTPHLRFALPGGDFAVLPQWDRGQARGSVRAHTGTCRAVRR
jgi:hypothetical protein